MKCKTCKHWFDNGTDLCSCDRDALLREADFFCAAWEQKPVEKVYTVREKPTNADRIRSMSNEELAKWMGKNTSCQFCQIRAFCKEDKGDYCVDGWMAWLKAPVKDGKP